MNSFRSWKEFWLEEKNEENVRKMILLLVFLSNVLKGFKKSGLGCTEEMIKPSP
jgi:hypothetical protein